MNNRQRFILIVFAILSTIILLFMISFLKRDTTYEAPVINFLMDKDNGSQKVIVPLQRKPDDLAPIIKIFAMGAPQVNIKLNKVNFNIIEKNIIGTNSKLYIRLFNDRNPNYLDKNDSQDYLIYVKRILEYYECPYPIKAVLAQAYTEGGAGQFGIYCCSNNIFGIRATSQWDGLVYSRDLSKIYLNYADAHSAGAKILFKAYWSIEESVKDYLDLITKKYTLAPKTSEESYLQFLLDNGYGEQEMLNVWLELVRKKLKNF